MNAPDQTLFVLTGPTAVGKTALALAWADANNAEIVSCDSLLFYRGMDIGTAKPTATGLSRVKHHLIDIMPVTEVMDIAQFVTLARAVVADIHRRGKRVLVTGGSGFYLKAFFGPVADSVAVPSEVRAAVMELDGREGLSGLNKRLDTLNPQGVGALDRDNPRRVTRALERCMASGRSVLELQAEFAAQPGPFADYRTELVRLERDDGELRDRIRERITAMVRGGLLDEVERLREAGLMQNPAASRAIGYRETLACLEGQARLTTLADTIANNTWKLVRKQRIWFRGQLPPHAIFAAERAKVETLFSVPA